MPAVSKSENVQFVQELQVLDSSRLIFLLILAFFACATLRVPNVYAKNFGQEPVPWRRVSNVCIVLVLLSAVTPHSQGCGHDDCKQQRTLKVFPWCERMLPLWMTDV